MSSHLLHIRHETDFLEWMNYPNYLMKCGVRGINELQILVLIKAPPSEWIGTDGIQPWIMKQFELFTGLHDMSVTIVVVLLFLFRQGWHVKLSIVLVQRSSVYTTMWYRVESRMFLMVKDVVEWSALSLLGVSASVVRVDVASFHWAGMKRRGFLIFDLEIVAKGRWKMI